MILMQWLCDTVYSQHCILIWPPSFNCMYHKITTYIGTKITRSKDKTRSQNNSILMVVVFYFITPVFQLIFCVRCLVDEISFDKRERGFECNVSFFTRFVEFWQNCWPFSVFCFEKLISLKKLFVTLKQKFYLYGGFFTPPTNCLSLFTCRERPICEDRFLNCDILPRAPWQLLHGVEPNFHFQDKATCSASFGGYEAYFKMHMCPNCCKSFVPFAQVLIPGFPRLISCPPTGLEDYIKRYGEGIRRVLTSFGPVPDFAGEGAKSIINVSVMAAKETML